MQWLSLLAPEMTTGQTAVLHLNCAPSLVGSDFAPFVGGSDLFAQAGATVQTF